MTRSRRSSKASGPTGDEARALEFLAEVEAELKPLSVALHLADWEATTTGTPESQRKAAECETRLRTFLSSRPRYERIVELRDSPKLGNPLLRRQLELLALSHRPNLLAPDVIDDLVRRSKAIESEFVNYRAQLDGRAVTNNQLLEIMRTERDSRRRQAAWEASKQIAPRVSEQLRELVVRRNTAARSLGFRDYYAMRLELDEIDEAELLRTFDELRRLTDDPYNRAKAEVDRRLAARYAIQPEELRPWHYEDPFFQEPPLSQELGLGAYFKGGDLVAIADDFYRGIGLPLRDVLDRSDLFERPGKDQHAYCTNIDREEDIRVLCNLEDNDHWMGVLLHELGHAAYEKFMPRSLPWILRQPAHIATTEAIAMFMDRLAYDVGWLESAAGAKPAKRNELAERAAATLRFELLLTARWVLVMTYFERDLYANPERSDLNGFWWDLVEDLQRVHRPQGRDAPDWAAKIHLAVAPVYYHNYLLGELIASQLAAALRREVLKGGAASGWVGRPELGDFLQERMFKAGASIAWQTLLEGATGSRLAPDAFLEEFGR